ncbi:hypothetical protein G6F46_004197 [Rhizopus delemar]|uniref:Uncharacterized protein n=2 Tax=Rhizopus TaxID=4842 RepID=A0A9P6ZCY9_9FUNG|nr:hypothetical protein G6F55_007370 [Rhizopus delemar]KAG1544547.1 hypothetical protein G6F51_005996 [Rhizopus arrhizus]KAG1495815.1 hypothetical protein G6F54_006907 [Rhizopus delemar]KAG1508440.1 hypothetical protein G6F52_011392 [Rhizopus delemar]KAG1509691.1 hypothetical protein G6F53_007243 [Rhizopus delemar]
MNSNLINTQLQSLERLKQKTQTLIDVKSTLVTKTEILDQKKALLEQVNSERQRLNKEKKLLLDMLQSIQRDLDSMVEAEKALTKEYEDLERNVNKYRIEQYEPLQDEVNEIRVKSGMMKLPHIQQELEAKMAKVLEDRRMKWQEGSSSSNSRSKR